MMKCLNLGCGKRYLTDWTNIDFYSDDASVIAHDLSKGLPFEENSFDFVYNSHLLEHFTKYEAENFLKECRRVLKHNGVLRVVVPDLELMATRYLEALQKAKKGMQGWDANYEWTVLHMFDQMVRKDSGGEMLEYIGKGEIPNEDFVVQMWGGEARQLIALLRDNLHGTGRDDERREGPSLSMFYQQLTSLRKKIREKLIKTLLGSDSYFALQLGRFRLSGEIHQWMYDQYSTTKLLIRCGFMQVITRRFDESYLPEWSKYMLDRESDGSQYRPDSLYMEAIKVD